MSSTKIKVFQVLECGGPGGTGNQVAAICNGLDPQRFDVGLVFACRDSKPEDFLSQIPGARFTAYVPEMVREISPVKDWAAFRKLCEIFKKERPAVVHAHSSKAGVLARLAARKTGVPKIFYSPHGYGFLQQDRGAFARFSYRLDEWAISWIGKIVAVSPSEAALAQPLAHSREVAVVCDAYLGESLSPEPHDGILVGGCGRLTAARNPDAFVHLSQRMSDSRNGLKCVWIGGGELEAKMRRDLENMNMLPKVSVTGWLPAIEARKRLAGLDLFVHYSAWDAMPNAVLEAMAAGLAVVASDIPANRDLIVPGVTGLLAGSEIELLEACLKLVDNPDLRRKMGQAGKERVFSQFSREKALSALTALYSA